MENKRKYKFFWDLIGDINTGRPNLGLETRLEVYRLMQFSFRDVLEQRLGTEATDEIFYDSGYLAGTEMYKAFFSGITDFNEFIRCLQEKMKELKIGIVRIEKADFVNWEFTITVSEDLDCSGLPELDYEICIYDEGMLSGLLEGFTQRKFKVKEIDCWCTGDRTCRFEAKSLI